VRDAAARMVGSMSTNSTNVDQLIDALIEREGGYVNHPADKGGPTCWGITERVARAYGYDGPMRDLPRARAKAIYRQVYWMKPGFHAVSLRYPALSVELFDIGVNMGVGVAGAFLQRVLNVMNQHATHFPEVTADGAIGPVTLLALDEFRTRRGTEGGEALLEAVRSLRGARYIEISEARPANEAFTYGWFRRMVEMVKDRFGR
jgi:lysozyme family protein